MKKANKRKFSPKAWAVLVSVALLVTVAVGSTVAFLAANGGSVTNMFEPTKVTSAVYENNGAAFSGETKTNVKVQNTGDVDAYVRAAVVITWQDENGNVLAEKPVEGTDYTIDWNTVEADKSDSKQWFTGNDGYYYYKTAVSSGQATAQPLISSITNAKTITEGDPTSSVCVEILSSDIQADPFRQEGKSGYTGASISSVWPAVKVSGEALTAN